MVEVEVTGSRSTSEINITKQLLSSFQLLVNSYAPFSHRPGTRTCLINQPTHPTHPPEIYQDRATKRVESVVLRRFWTLLAYANPALRWSYREGSELFGPERQTLLRDASTRTPRPKPSSRKGLITPPIRQNRATQRVARRVFSLLPWRSLPHQSHLKMHLVLENSINSPTHNNQFPEERKQSPSAFLDLVDSWSRTIFLPQAARLGSNLPDCRPVSSMSVSVFSSARYSRINPYSRAAAGPGAAQFSHFDAETLSKAVGTAVSDKRKSVTYAPSVNLSPDLNTGSAANNNSFSRAAGAKSMPASRRTSASEHDEELAGHLQNLSMAGEHASPGPVPVSAFVLSRGSSRYADDEGARYASTYNAGMILDEQLDQEMHNAMRNLPTSDHDKFNSFAGKISTSSAALDLAHISQTSPRASFATRTLETRDKSSEWPQFAGSGRAPAHDAGVLRADRRTVTNPNLTLSAPSSDASSGKLNTVSASTTPLGQQHPQLVSHAQLSTSRRGSPPSLLESLNATTRSVPATPLGISNSAVHILKSPGTPHTPETQALNGRLASPRSSATSAKSMAASCRRTSASEHDEELAGHLQNLSMAGERASLSLEPSSPPRLSASLDLSASGLSSASSLQSPASSSDLTAVACCSQSPPCPTMAQASFSFSEVDVDGTLLDPLPPEIGAADLSIAPDGSFAKTSSGAAARKLKKRYDQRYGVNVSVHSPYAITSDQSAWKRGLSCRTLSGYLSVRNRKKKTPPAAATSVDIDQWVSQANTTGESSRRSRLSVVPPPSAPAALFGTPEHYPHLRWATPSFLIASATSVVFSYAITIYGPHRSMRGCVHPQYDTSPAPAAAVHAAFIASPLVLATHSAVPTLRSRPSPSTHHERDASCTSPTYALRPSSATLHRLLKARSCRAMRVLRAPPPAYAAHAAALSSQGRSGEPSSRQGHAVIARPFGPTIFFESPSRKPNVKFLPTLRLLCEMQSFESGLTAKQADLEQPFFDEASVNRSEGSRPHSAFCTYRGPPLLEKPCFKSSAVTASTIFVCKVGFCPYFKARFHHSSFLLPTMSESTNATAPLELVDGVNALELQCEELKRLNSALAWDHGELHARFIALATDFKELAAEYEKLYAEYDALVEDHEALATKHEVLATKYQRLRALHARTVIPSHAQLSTFRRSSPPSLLENLNATTRSVPATPLGISNSMVHIFKSPGTPHMPETQALNGRLASVSENVVNAGDLQASLSWLPLGQLMVSRTSTAAKADSTSLRAMPLFSSLVVNYSISSPKSRLLPVCLLPMSDLPHRPLFELLFLALVKPYHLTLKL
ncbi:hypothetical protein K438DRAFT_1779688 [Mycena galopus ATCC 62051]|nr:hypothetical protein K438DRAFT_1779688 [Mycena galopus ATCC 62051]